MVNSQINPECTNLVPGQTLCLGTVASEDCTQTYVVKAADDCDNIASTVGLNTTMMSLNNPQINEGCTNIYIGEVRDPTLSGQLTADDFLTTRCSAPPRLSWSLLPPLAQLPLRPSLPPRRPPMPLSPPQPLLRHLQCPLRPLPRPTRMMTSCRGATSFDEIIFHHFQKHRSALHQHQSIYPTSTHIIQVATIPPTAARSCVLPFSISS